MIEQRERAATTTTAPDRIAPSPTDTPSPSNTKTLLDAINETLFEEMRADERIIVLGEDVGQRGGVFRVTAGLLDEFGPERVMDAPLAESVIVGGAIGMAMNGLLPIAEIQFLDFIHPAMGRVLFFEH